MSAPVREPGQAAGSQMETGVAQLMTLLVPGETIEAHAHQRRIFAITHRRAYVAATSGRFIGLARGLLGGFHPVDVRWQDLRGVSLSVGIFGAGLILEAFTSPDLAVAGETRSLRFDGLQKEPAQEVYRICQAQEQAWREKRRVRELEELRAKSGGIQLGSSTIPAATLGAGARGAEGPAARLAEAKGMLDQGLISDSEYESLKARIVSGL